MATLLAGTACLPPGAEASRNAALRTFLDGWKGQPLETFLQATGWKPTLDRGVDKGGLRAVEFSAYGAWAAPDTWNSVAYHSITPLVDGMPAPPITGGPDQPVGTPPNPAQWNTETLRFHPPRPGCQLTLQVDGQGLIRPWLHHAPDAEGGFRGPGPCLGGPSHQGIQEHLPVFGQHQAHTGRGGGIHLRPEHAAA